MKISETYDLFIFEKEVSGIYKSTIKTYNNIVKHIFIDNFIGDIDVQELELKDLQKFIISLRNKDISVNTVKTYWRHVKAFIKYLYRNEFIEHDLSVKIPPMKGYKPIKDIYLDDEIQLIFSSIQGNSVTALQKRAIFCLLLDTGMRQAEITRIEFEDINIRHKYINIRGSKGHEDRRVPISIATIKAVNKYMQKRIIPFNDENQNLMFVNRDGKGVTNRTIRSYIDTNVKNNGITKGNTHLFRHTFITRKCMETNDAFYVQQLAGHKDLSTTKMYYQYANSYTIAKVKLMPIEQLLASISM
ncbi:MAG: tyrosine-type recombinase/integrase [Vallitalea sp.]|jgi:site-specific recombinase XerD|nr:tyrosine-type recombinase/integrase [Vallitalea sp.]